MTGVLKTGEKQKHRHTELSLRSYQNHNPKKKIVLNWTYSKLRVSAFQTTLFRDGEDKQKDWYDF